MTRELTYAEMPPLSEVLGDEDPDPRMPHYLCAGTEPMKVFTYQSRSAIQKMIEDAPDGECGISWEIGYEIDDEDPATRRMLAECDAAREYRNRLHQPSIGPRGAPMTDVQARKREVHRKSLAVDAISATIDFRRNIDAPKPIGDALLERVARSEAEMLPLLQADGLERYSHSTEEGTAYFHVVTEESTDNGRSGTVEDWGKRSIEPRCEFRFEQEGD